MKKALTGTVVIILTLVTILLFYSFEKEDSRFNKAGDYVVIQKWELPEQLKEISAIEWLGNDKIAAVQDEEGIIFIYDLKQGAIEAQIKFGQGGDYEGLRISEGTAYVLRSDGTVFEIRDYSTAQPLATLIETPLAEIKGIDVEGLSLDKDNNRLLLSVKENKKEKGSRGVYALDLDTRELSTQTIFDIKLSDPVFGNGKFNPSEIEVHPGTGEYYLLDAKNFQLLITNEDGRPKELHHLAAGEFAKAEGLSFSPEGTLYISNEAGDGPANILQVELN